MSEFTKYNIAKCINKDGQIYNNLENPVVTHNDTMTKLNNKSQEINATNGGKYYLAQIKQRLWS